MKPQQPIDAAARKAGTVAFTVPGRLGGWQRTGRHLRSGVVQSYTPSKMRSHQATVKWFAQVPMRGRALLEGPLRLDIEMWRIPPKSWSKKKVAQTQYVTGTPDLDNCVKLIGDALNGVVWRDDAQIADLRIMRRYAPTGGEYVEVTVTPLDDFERNCGVVQKDKSS